MASIAGLYGSSFGANQEDGSGGRIGFFGGFRSVAAKKAAGRGAEGAEHGSYQAGTAVSGINRQDDQ